MPDYNEVVDTVIEELRVTLNSIDPEAVTNLCRDILQARNIFVVGRGRSGLQMQAFAMRLMHLDLSVQVVGAITATAIGAGDLLIIGSGSGSTEPLAHYAERARSLNAQVTLITTVEDSLISKYADSVVRIAAPTPKSKKAPDSNTSIQPMGSLFEQTLGILLDVLIIQLMSDLAVDASAMFARHANLE